MPFVQGSVNALLEIAQPEEGLQHAAAFWNDTDREGGLVRHAG